MTALIPMPTIALRRRGAAHRRGRAGRRGVPRSLSGSDAGCMPVRPEGVLPVGRRRRARHPVGEPTADRALRSGHGASGSCRDHHRPAAVHVLRLLPVAHIDGRIASNPAQYVRRPKVHPNDTRGLDRWELGAFPLSERSEETEHVVVVFCRNELVCEGSHCGELTLCVGADPIRTSGDMGGGRAEPRVDLDAGGRKMFPSTIRRRFRIG